MKHFVSIERKVAVNILFCHASFGKIYCRTLHFRNIQFGTSSEQWWHIEWEKNLVLKTKQFLIWASHKLWRWCRLFHTTPMINEWTFIRVTFLLVWMQLRNTWTRMCCEENWFIRLYQQSAINILNIDSNVAFKFHQFAAAIDNFQPLYSHSYFPSWSSFCVYHISTTHNRFDRFISIYLQ